MGQVLASAQLPPAWELEGEIKALRRDTWTLAHREKQHCTVQKVVT